MASGRYRSVAIIMGSLLIVALIVAPYAWRCLEAWGVGLHQRSVTLELANWEREHQKIENWADVERAVGMLEYIDGYYVPADGYRSDPQTEAMLQAQRAQTCQTIAAALHEYTGEDLGSDSAAWRHWLATKP
jgi:hypothetical protein